MDEVIVHKICTPEKYLIRPEAVYISKNTFKAIKSGTDHHQKIFAAGKEICQWYELYKTILREARMKGIPLVIGTDAGAYGEIPYGVLHGFSLHDELRILTENGFSPYESIALTTRGTAEAINRQEEWGTIEIGKSADFILTQKNPFETIENLKIKQGVMVARKWYSENQLQKMIFLEDWR